MHYKSKTTAKLFFLTGTGLLAGLVNGLLGAGGGVLIVLALSKVCAGGFEDKRDVFVHALCVMTPLSLLSIGRYAAAGHAETMLTNFTPFLWPAVLGGIGGALLLGKLNVKWLGRIFALLVIWSGLYMLFGS